MIEMFVTGVALDIRTNIPLVILNDQDKNYTLPIWIGQAEAQAIARGLSSMETERPMTHDLFVEVLDTLDASIDCIEINSYEDSTFFASIILLDKDEKSYAIDSRPSDSIALALRLDAPIMVSQKILDDVASKIEFLTDSDQDIEPITDPHARKEFREFIKEVKASDFNLDRQINDKDFE